MQYTLKCQAANRAECTSPRCPDRNVPAHVRKHALRWAHVERTAKGPTLTAADMREMFNDALELERQMLQDQEAFEAYYNNGAIDWDVLDSDAF